MAHKSISNGKAPFRVPKVLNGTSNNILEPQMEPIVFYHSNHSLQMSIYFNILLYFYLAAAARSTKFILCIKNSRWESYQRL